MFAFRKLSHVRLGDYDLTTEPDCVYNHGKIKKCADSTQEIRNLKVIPHRAFHFLLKVYADIGLIRLNEPAKLNQNNINTICLPFSFTQVPQSLQVIGWGLTVALLS